MSDEFQIYDHIDHQRWLLEHGFINDLHKDNLYMYGAIVHKDVQAVQLDIDVERKRVVYHLYCDKSLLNKIEKYQRLSESTGLFGLWRFKRMLTKEGNLNIKHLLSNFVKDYCGPKWRVQLDLNDYRDYKDGFEEEQKQEESREADKQPDS
jgi:hypothetical protein